MKISTTTIFMAAVCIGFIHGMPQDYARDDDEDLTTPLPMPDMEGNGEEINKKLIIVTTAKPAESAQANPETATVSDKRKATEGEEEEEPTTDPNEREAEDETATEKDDEDMTTTAKNEEEIIQKLIIITTASTTTTTTTTTTETTTTETTTTPKPENPSLFARIGDAVNQGVNSLASGVSGGNIISSAALLTAAASPLWAAALVGKKRRRRDIFANDNSADKFIEGHIKRASSQYA